MPVRSAGQVLITAAEMVGSAVVSSARKARGLGNRYARANKRHPVRTQAVTASVVAGLGDALMQNIEISQAGGDVSQQYDALRTARFCAFRLLVFGPVLAVWMRGLERLVRVPGKRGVAMKIGLDQFVLQPPMLCTFYFSMAVLEGSGPSVGATRAAEMLVPTMKLNVPFWVSIHTVTFTAIPPQYRVAWISLIQIGWNAVMSHLNQSAVKNENENGNGNGNGELREADNEVEAEAEAEVGGGGGTAGASAAVMAEPA